MEKLKSGSPGRNVGIASLSVLTAASLLISVFAGDTALAGSVPPSPPSTAGADATPAMSLPVRDGRIVSAGPADAATKVASLADGDILELSSGGYQGLFDVKANNTTVRAGAGQTPVFTGDGRFLLSGRNTIVAGLRFQSSVAPVVELKGSGHIVYGNTFAGAGDGRDGSSVGLITIRNPTPGWDGTAGPDGLNPPLVATNHRVVANTVLQPRNTVYWQSHGVLHNVFSHNTIQGPHSISGSETMAVKLGFGFGAEDTFTEISYNTINDWKAWPYVIGVKSSSTRINYNLLSKGRLQIRYGHRNEIRGNVILDGDIHAGGDANVIAENYVRTLNPVDDFGPLALFGRSGLLNSFGDYSGKNGRPPFIMEFSNGQVSGNTFISGANDIATVINIWYDEPILEFPMRNTTFSTNRFHRNSAAGFLATAVRNGGPTGPLNQQTFIGNSFHCPTTCDEAQLPGSVQAAPSGPPSATPATYGAESGDPAASTSTTTTTTTTTITTTTTATAPVAPTTATLATTPTTTPTTATTTTSNTKTTTTPATTGNPTTTLSPIATPKTTPPTALVTTTPTAAQTVAERSETTATLLPTTSRPQRRAAEDSATSRAATKGASDPAAPSSESLALRDGPQRHTTTPSARNSPVRVRQKAPVSRPTKSRKSTARPSATQSGKRVPARSPKARSPRAVGSVQSPKSRPGTSSLIVSRPRGNGRNSTAKRVGTSQNRPTRTTVSNSATVRTKPISTTPTIPLTPAVRKH